MNLLILPSESQVMSTSVVLRSGDSLSRWMGMIGNNCPSAQWSSSDWNTEKLQRYWSAREFDRSRTSSGM